MPVLAGNVPRFVVHLDNEDFRMIRYDVRGAGINVQLADTAPEGHVLLDTELLVAEEDDETIHERVMDLLEAATTLSHADTAILTMI
jgi:hypothetical protein